MIMLMCYSFTFTTISFLQQGPVIVCYTLFKGEDPAYYICFRSFMGRRPNRFTFANRFVMDIVPSDLHSPNGFLTK